jgi:hypothetical protein
MADIEYGEYYGDSDSDYKGSVRTLINWAGALCSLVLMAGLTTWGYQLLMRDVTGVPVVRALEGPMRVAPDDPGGATAEHQGLAVNSVAADGGTERPAERVVLAPAPLDLTPEDQPISAILPNSEEADPMLADAVEEEGLGVDPEPGLAITDAIATDEQSEPAETQSAIELALAEALDAPLPDASTSTVSASPTIEIIPASVAGVSSSPRPVIRPAVVEAVEQTSASLEPTPTPAAQPAMAVASNGLDVDINTIASGTRLVQLGAFPSAEDAKSEWVRLDASFGDYMDGKQRVVQQAKAGGKTFYRLRAVGFEGLSDARRFCAVLVDKQQNCIPVVRR